VGLLSRNVLLRGAAADSPATDPQPQSETCSTDQHTERPCTGTYYMTGYGGHVMITGGAAARVSGAEFFRMGQTNVNGRYPMHLHLLGAVGASSYVSDCSVHESFYRGVVVHGTNGTVVTRNVAYDVIGHCYYMESGNEENNEISFNLGAHVHMIGFFNIRGQATGTAFTSADLGGAEVPADGAASAFYISNMYNNFTGNAAVGGFSGFAMVTFPKVIGEWPPGVPADDSYAPKNRPNLPDGFYGNSARSTGYWWNLGACFYVGGVLQVTDETTGALTYIPGRVSGPPHNRQPVENGQGAWFKFVNSKASLCNVAAEDWNVRSKWYNMDVNDLGDRTFNTFGMVVFRNVNIQCRTANGHALVMPHDNTVLESEWRKMSFKMFRAYDTGQSHVLDAWRIEECGTAAAPLRGLDVQGAPQTEFRAAQIWSIVHGVNMPQNQLVMRNITYADGDPDPAKLISFDVGQRDTYGAYFMNLLDADGSLTQRRAGPSDCRPTVVGSAHTIRATSGGYDQTNSNLWFKLTGLDDGAARGSASNGDARCDLMSQAEYPMWACDRGSISVAAILVVPNEREQTTARTKQVWGGVAHWGDSLADGPPLSGDHQVVGPHDHAHRGGWFLQYHSAADDASSWSSPKKLEINAQQIENGGVLLVALAYPAGTTFVIRRKTGSRSNAWLGYTTATSVAAIRQDSAASKYYFDGTYLYLRMPDVEAGTVPGFGEDGLYIPLRSPSWDKLEITATWAGATGCGAAALWCRAATQSPPAASVGEVPGTSTPIPCPASAGPYWPIRDAMWSAQTPSTQSPPSVPPVPPVPPPDTSGGELTYSFEIVVAGTVEDARANEATIKASVASNAGISVDQVAISFTAASVIVGVTITAASAAELTSIEANVDPLLADTTQAGSLLGSSVTVESIRSRPGEAPASDGGGNGLGVVVAAAGAAVLLATALIWWYMYKRSKRDVAVATGTGKGAQA